MIIHEFQCNYINLYTEDVDSFHVTQQQPTYTIITTEVDLNINVNIIIFLAILICT